MTNKVSVTKEDALNFHMLGNKPGKVAISPTKPLLTQWDLSLAYSPGVAYPCIEIYESPNKAYDYTSKGNMVAVISNGTAVLGLGNLGALASKPVMEGKAVLFKRFADIDAIDIEVDTTDPEEFINAVKYLGCTWGGINLEDIKSPECFMIEERLSEMLDIPVFHDDQHGTAIITAAAMINAAHITKRDFADIKLVCNGAGAAGIACIELLKKLGMRDENVIICDTSGVVYKGRTDGMQERKAMHAVDTDKRTLADAMNGADVFLGLSVKGVVSKAMVASMAKDPIIFAMANPDPEITPEEIREVRSDAIIATGRSDYFNQVNNIMGFPYIFRGALDVRASRINDDMKIAAAYALAKLAREPIPDEVSEAYAGRRMKYGREYLIPVPFDPRLISTVASAVAEAAMKSGVARKTVDLKEYRKELSSRLNPTNNYMNFIYEKIHTLQQRVVFADGDEDEVIKAAIMMQNNEYGVPILIGRPENVTAVLKTMGHEDLIDKLQIYNAALAGDRLDVYIDYLYSKLQRNGYLLRDCARLVKRDRNVFAACMVACGDADGLVTGLTKGYLSCLEEIERIIPKCQKNVFGYAILVMKDKNLLISDISVTEVPTPDELAHIAIQSAAVAKKMGNKDPRVAFLSFSNFGNPMRERATRIRDAIKILDNIAETEKFDFEYDGEMSPDVALSAELQKRYPFCRLSGPANILIMPALHSAIVSTKLIESLAGGKLIGPILTGLEKPVQIVDMGANAETIMNMAAFVAAQAIDSKHS